MKKIILLYYKYIYLENPKEIRIWQYELCQSLGLVGRIIVAHEGINGTLEGSEETTSSYVKVMREHPLFKDIDFKTSEESSEHVYFSKLSVKVKPEIVNFGKKAEGISHEAGGIHLTPEQTHELLKSEDKDLVVLDGRNYYEARVGTFQNAITPKVDHFRDFPDYIDENKDLFKDKKVLMFCTGGVRCERASAYLKAKDVAKEVYQVEGGIHRYVEKFPDGFFRGKNYVFDQRITVPVTDDILGTCDVCAQPCDEFTNCSSSLCNKHFISCPECVRRYDNACSEKCYKAVSSGQVQRRIYKPKAPANRVQKR